VDRSAGDALVVLWRRFQAFGGWVAHLLNTSPRLDPFHDEAVRPKWVFLWLAFLALVATLGLDFLQSWRIASLVASCLAWVVALAIVLGLKAGYVPCVSTRADETKTTATEELARPLRSLAVRVTGVVDAHSGARYQGRKSRYRERPATLERYRGVLRISVMSWTASLPSRSDARRPDRYPCGYALLERETVSSVSCATAYLTTATKPAIRLNWLYGPVILTFADATARDEAFAEIRMLRTTGPTEPTVTGLREATAVDETAIRPA
jgi:hypothetical protein